MRKLWNMGGRRVTAFLMAAFIAFMSIPSSNWGALSVSAEQTEFTITVSAENAEGNAVDLAVGTVEVSDLDANTSGDDTAIALGDSRTIIVTPAEGYVVSKMIVKASIADATEEVTEDADESTDVFEYVIASVEDDYEITVVFEEEQTAVKHVITVEQTGNGTVTVENGTITDGEFEVEEGTDVKLVFVPDAENKVMGISVDGTALAITDGVYKADGSYEYTLAAVDAAKTVSVEFAEIAGESMTNTAAMAELGILSDKEGNEITITDDNNQYCAEEITLTAPSGKLLSLDYSGPYAATISITSTQELEHVYVHEEIPTDFGTERKIVFTTPITLLIDGAKPVVMLDEASMLIGPTDTEVSISGSVVEENLEKVVGSDRTLEEADILAAAGNANVAQDGTFTYLGQIPVGSNAATFYFYAVDKAGLVSDEVSLSVERDVTAPEITNVTINSALNSYAHGNYSNSAVSVTVTANDVSDGGAVSGAQKIKLYIGNAADAFAEVSVSETITDARPYEFPVELAPTIAELASLTEIQISVVDNKGNESSRTTLAGSGLASGLFMIENQAPTVVRGNIAGYDKTDENGAVVSGWYKEIPEKIAFKLSDKNADQTNGSGILSATVAVDGNDLAGYAVDDSASATPGQDKVIEILAADFAGLENGEHSVLFEVSDFAGNTTTETLVIGIDNGAPMVTEVLFEETEAVSRLNLVGFQNAYNTMVKITVTVADTAENGSDDTTVPCVGAKEATLYLNSAMYETATVDTNNQAVFVIPQQLLENQFLKYTDISVITKDYLGNESNHVIIDETTNGSLIIETKKPVIEEVNIRTAGDGRIRAEKTETSAVFYCNKDENGKPNIDFIVKASDKDDNSGLKNIKVVLNNQVVYEEEYVNNAQLFAAFTVGESMFDLKNITSADVYEGTITVTDEAGNATEFELTVYVDTAGPTVGTPDVTDPTSEVANIAYYNGNVVVTVIPEDGDDGVGATAIEWGVIGENGTENSIGTIGVGADGKATFTVAPSTDEVYEENIYIKAIDELGNVGTTVVLDKIIIETQSQHNGTEEKHVQVTNNTTSNYKDAKNNPLYTGTDAGKVNVSIEVTDSYNGISSIEWTVASETGNYANLAGNVAVSGSTLTSTEGTWTVEESADFVSKIGGELEVDASAVEANDITVTFTMTDLSGNKSTGKVVFSVDKTAPKIEVTFDDTAADSEYTNVYKDTRIATVTVTDRNFGEKQLVLDITNSDGATPQITDWTTKIDASNPNKTTSVGTIVFAEEGDYTVSLSGKDLAGQSADTVSVEEFTIDKTAPIVTVSYLYDNALNGNYYAETQTAVIEIEEHNFVEERIEITGTATLDGTQISFPTLGAWNGSGDTYTATLTFDADGLYQFTVDYADKAGNESEQYVGEEFYIDMTAPVIEITGVEDMSANNGDVVPRISITDSNYNAEGVTIDLYGANGGNQTPNGAYSGQANGQIYTFANFPKEQSSDDIYTVTATATDMAGNETMDEITFSVNRFGSVYVFDNSLKEIAGTYVQEEIDVMLTEVNVDSLEHDSIRVVVDANGSLKDLTEGVDYTVSQSGGNGSWYQYDYTIDKSLFAGDGRYIVTLYSEDVAGNVNENIDESKEAEISFGIDKTPPVIIPIDIASEEQYDLDVKTATVTVNDNLVLQDVQVFVGENQSEYTAEGENYVFDIPSSTDRQDITIAAVDAAGNRTNYVISGVLVTTNAFIRLINNTPLLVGSILSVAGIGGGGVAFVGLRRRRKYNLKMK